MLNHLIRRSPLFVILPSAFILLCAVTSLQADTEAIIKGDVEWPTHWTVFAPYSETDELVDTTQLTTIPASLRTMRQGVTDRTEVKTPGRVMAIKPGHPVDLVEVFERQSPRNAAFVFLELESPVAQTVTLGAGADWWMEVWLNGSLVYDTLSKKGNLEWPISMTNHTFDVELKEGTNILAVRILTGSGSSLLALGGPQQYAEQAAAFERKQARNPNQFPEDFADRQLFPTDIQATVMAEKELELPSTNADLAAGELAGLQMMLKRQIEGRGDILRRWFKEPVKIRLGKDLFPWEDRHLDAIVWLSPPDKDAPVKGSLDVLLKDADGNVLSRNTINKLSPNGVFFSIGFPPQLEGSEAELEVVWMDQDKEIGRAVADFIVLPPSGVATSGRVPLDILNATGAVVTGAPMTLGVPFPRGALYNPDNVRLVDEHGAEQPLQARETGRWSRYGPVRWLRCDFTVDLDGKPRQWFLEYGPDVQRTAAATISVQSSDTGFPPVNAGRLKVADNVLAYDFSGNGDYQPLLDLAAMTGAFVSHETDGRFITPADVTHAVEDIGPERILLRRTGWYRNPDNGEKFCQFVTRIALFHDSPVVRIFHTWIYTGDSNHDRIAEMGWNFKTALPIEDGAFLTAFDDGEWITAPALVQFDFQHYLLPDSGEETVGRTPGVATMRIGDSRMTFGVRNFWQNFPAELAFEKEGFTFYNWPRRNPPARMERPVPVGEAYKLRFAHEGELLDLRMPDEYAERPIWHSATRGSKTSDYHYAQDRPESVNAQGVALTEEMFLYFTPADTSPTQAARVIQGLNDETLRAVVSPQWMAASEVFGKIHPLDLERFEEEERLYSVVVSAPPKWVERLGVYGKWVYGDFPTWNINLNAGRVDNYRAFRKTHHGFPYRLIPFARTGDPQFYRIAQNSARHIADKTFCHYATAEVDASVGPDHYRQQGWWKRNMFPWAGGTGPWNRAYITDSDYLWDYYQLSGYERARDVLLLFAELTKVDHRTIPATRYSQSVLRNYIDMYQATFDPWFLNAIHEIADVHIQSFGGEHENDPLNSTAPRDNTGYDHWRRADQAFYNFSGRRDFRQVAVNSAVSYANPRKNVIGAGASANGGVGSEHIAYAWYFTQDPFYLRRAAASLDFLRYATYEGEPDYFQGVTPASHGNEPLAMARTAPLIMAILADLEEVPDPIHQAVWINPNRHTKDFPPISIQHDGNGPLLISLDARGGGTTREPLHCRITGPDGVLFDKEISTSDENLVFDVPAGIYTVELSGDLRLFLPLTMPDVPEVLHFPTTDLGSMTSGGSMGYWFYVPEGTSQFTVRYETPGGAWPVHRGTAWNPLGERAWDRSFHNDDMPVEATIPVPPGQDGQLWRATGGNVIVGDTVPPFFSLSRTKWFNPEE